jgi:ABC-type transport system involved in multi-copper enzyme maturation permease subunit
MRDISKIILDFCLMAIGIGGLLVPFFLAINLLSKDIERKTIYTILSRQVSRGEYILGKYLGLILLSGLVILILTAASLVAIFIGKIIYGDFFFRNFGLYPVFLASFFIWISSAVLTSLVTLWCAITTSSFLATLLTLFTYIIGQTIDDVVRFVSAETAGVEISQSVKYAVKIVKYLFPNLSVFDLKLQAAHNIIVPAGESSILFAYAVIYSLAALSCSILIFRKRDLV